MASGVVACAPAPAPARLIVRPAADKKATAGRFMICLLTTISPLTRPPIHNRDTTSPAEQDTWERRNRRVTIGRDRKSGGERRSRSERADNGRKDRVG